MRKKSYFVIGSIVGACMLMVGMVFYDLSRNQIDQWRAPLYSERDMLQSLWNQYKNEYIEDTGRTIDKQRDNITTSEGQSYTMLRAVWMDDKQTFDHAWRWTKDNLRKDSFLFSWKFGQRANGSYGVLISEGGKTSATDGDTDIALALILAYARWGDEKYLPEAREVLDAVWQHEVITIDGLPYILSNDIEKYSDKQLLLINPSYLSPYAYRIFARIDTAHDWNALVHTSYDVLFRSMRSSFDQQATASLPPDWITINRTTGEIQAAVQDNLTTNYGYDAMRVVWRIALDYKWFASRQAYNMLSDFSFLHNEWMKKHTLSAVYSHAGAVVDSGESFSMYATALAYFKFIDTAHGAEIYKTKLLKNYNVDTFQWYEDPGYYAQNWAWFGMALYVDRLYNYADFLMTDNRYETDE